MGQLIFWDESRHLDKLSDLGDCLVRLQEEINWTLFLPTIKKGYETGLRLLHHMGLTTQMPTQQLLATNAAKDCIRFDRKLGVSICPPKAPVNAENKAYLQMLDAIDLLEKAPVDAQNPYEILADQIRRNGLQYEKLLYYADRYYNRKTIIQLAHTAGQREVSVETVSGQF